MGIGSYVRELGVLGVHPYIEQMFTYWFSLQQGVGILPVADEGNIVLTAVALHS